MKSLYLTTRFFQIAAGIIFLFIISFFFPVVFAIAKALMVIFLMFILIDILLLYNSPKNAISGKRETGGRLSNGDENIIKIHLKNNYRFAIFVNIIDEIPFQFQLRNFEIKSRLSHNQEKIITYKLRPVTRGEYSFGFLNVYVSSLLALVSRRHKLLNEKTVAVYPSFIQMKKYELLAVSNKLTEVGIKKIRKIANNNEFEQIKEYVLGDDFRIINWKATARRNQLMVNQYQDEKSQQVYNIIDMGRTMKMPFEEMALVDYAINASLVISNIAMLKHDKAGLITYSKGIHTLLPAERNGKQMLRIMEVLYNQTTNYQEPDFQSISAYVKHKIRHRSLILLYTNFEGFSSMKRQLSYMRAISKNHLLVVVFFENTELKKLTDKKSQNLEELYIKATAEKFQYEKKLIVKELQKHGIHSILTEPENLTISAINKYLQLKAQNMI